MKKPKILIFADKLNWAYHDIAKFIFNNLSDDYDIYFDFVRSHSITRNINLVSAYKKFKEKKKHLKCSLTSKDNSYDIVMYLGFYFDKYFQKKNKNFKNKFWKSKYIIKGIYTDGFPPHGSSSEVNNLKTFHEIHTKDSDAIVCGSKLINNRFKKLPIPVYYANISFDEKIWPVHEVKKNMSKKFVVSWTGNPNREFKGFYSHVLPAVEIAKKKYPDIVLKTRFSGPIETLHEHYIDVDTTIIASNGDAGPFSAVESCLCNVPMISTDVGFPHEIILSGINGFIVKRNIYQIAQKIIYLYENRDVLYKMSLRIRSDFTGGIGNIDNRIYQWRNLFQNVLNLKK